MDSIITWCPKCNKKKEAPITIVELTGEEHKFITTCPKCGTVVTRIIGTEFPQLKKKKL